MAGSRTLKLSILADVADLQKKLGQGSQEVEGFGSKLGDFGKKAGLVFGAAAVAAGAYATKLAVDGVKAAIEDEAAQERLRRTLINTTSASESQIETIDDYITATSIAFGVTDDQLRPSLERLARATGDLTKAQEAQSLALDIAAGTGKSLQAVSEGLGKAYEGNRGALARLGIGLGAAQLKTMSMAEITQVLADKFGGQASAQADTFQGKMERLSIAFDEAKETVGSYILSAIQPLADFTLNKAIPALEAFSSNLGSQLGPTVAKIALFFRDDLLPILQQWWKFLFNEVIPMIVGQVKPVFEALFEAFNDIRKSIEKNQEKLQPFYDLLEALWKVIKEFVAPAIGTIFVAAIKVLSAAVTGIINLFSTLVGLINSVVSGIKAIIKLVKENPLVEGLGNIIEGVFGGGKASGGPVKAGTTYLVGEKGPELFTPQSNGKIIPNGSLGGNTINITVNGAVDSASTARQIVNILNSEATLAGSFGTLGASYVVSG